MDAEARPSRVQSRRCYLVHAQMMLEYSVLVAVAALALIAIADYVRRAVNVHTRTIEQELNPGN